MVLMILYEISRHLGLRISDLGSRSLFRIFGLFFYFSSFWDIYFSNWGMEVDFK